MKRVDKKTCIITGAALGIGKACAERLADEGANIAVFDRLDDAGNALVKQLQDRGVNARYWHVDVSSEKNVQTAITEAAECFGSVDVLVNNAGIAGVNKPTHEVTEAEWDLVQSVNVKGVFFCTKHAIPFMKKQGAAASSIFLPSTDWSVRPMCRRITLPKVRFV